MLIGDKYKVISDSMNITLIELKQAKKQNGAEYLREEILGYYATIPNALKAMVNRDIQGMGLEDLKAIAKRQGELYILIASLRENMSVEPKEASV